MASVDDGGLMIAAFERLPGAELVARGLFDLSDGRETVEALLVRVGAPRLRAIGFRVPDDAPGLDFPEHRLYLLLAESHGNGAHSKYNALIRRLVSFERAAERLTSGSRGTARESGQPA